jgi:hypothetical protein
MQQQGHHILFWHWTDIPTTQSKFSIATLWLCLFLLTKICILSFPTSLAVSFTSVLSTSMTWHYDEFFFFIQNYLDNYFTAVSSMFILSSTDATLGSAISILLVYFHFLSKPNRMYQFGRNQMALGKIYYY